MVKEDALDEAEHKCKVMYSARLKSSTCIIRSHILSCRCLQKMGRDLRCHQRRMKFLCPRQFLCLGHGHDHRCLACVNPNCVTREDRKITKALLTAQNQTEQQDYLEMCSIFFQ